MSKREISGSNSHEKWSRSLNRPLSSWASRCPIGCRSKGQPKTKIWGKSQGYIFHGLDFIIFIDAVVLVQPVPAIGEVQYGNPCPGIQAWAQVKPVDDRGVRPEIFRQPTAVRGTVYDPGRKNGSVQGRIPFQGSGIGLSGPIVQTDSKFKLPMGIGPGQGQAVPDVQIVGELPRDYGIKAIIVFIV